jgi:hypothetical protein
MSSSTPHRDWVPPLVEELDLSSRRRSGKFDAAALWDQLRAHNILDRIHQAVVQLNREMNDDVLDYLEYAAPQSTVLRVAYRKRQRTMMMELVLREEGPKAVFYGRRPRGWLMRYLSGSDRSRVNVVLSRRFKADALGDAEIREWFSFLLSEFKRPPTREPKKSEGRPAVPRVTEAI